MSAPGERQTAVATSLDSRAHASPRQQGQKSQITQLREAPRHSNGLPAQLQRGIEALSGMDMSGVRVHRNSAKPAQLSAHAYAQGRDIHLGPGQEKHLPHEAWHVVQQAQGRVPATVQAKSTSINDDPGLEAEATRMGDRALQVGAGGALESPVQAMRQGANVVQRARYIKCIQNPGNMDGEITRLTAASPIDSNSFGGTNEYGQQLEINKWLSGGAGISTTHYNPGQNQYYSPVGFVVNVSDDRALGHFAGDGSTSLLHQGRPEYWQAFEDIRAAMRADIGIDGDINGNGYTADFANAVTNLATALQLKPRIEAFMADPLVSAPSKVATKQIIKTAASDALKHHYQHGGFNFPLGHGSPGVLGPLEANLQGLAAGTGYQNPVQNRENKYTESQVHAELAHVEGAFYAAELGSYADLINARWVTGNARWLSNRYDDAKTFNQKFSARGNAGVKMMHLRNGQLVDGKGPGGPILPDSFYRWALLALGLAIIYMNGPQLMALYQQYLGENPG